MKEKVVGLRLSERFFARLVWLVGILVLVVLLAIVGFLGWQALPVLAQPDQPLSGGKTGFWGYVLPFAFGSVWAAFLALVLATPVAIGVALFVTNYLPYKISRQVGYAVDLLAAIPSVVYGLWGLQVLAPLMVPVYAWLGQWFAWLPFFTGAVSGTGRTIFTAAVVLAVMILPVMTAISREVFLQIPRFLTEGALALGATRAEMIRLVVLPLGRAGIISSAILGLGRALGETVAIAIILSPAAVISFSLISSQNPNTIASNIALQFPEAQGDGLAALIASGLVLFVITLLINLIAQHIVGRQNKILRGI